jgi:hypothetical protein
MLGEDLHLVIDGNKSSLGDYASVFQTHIGRIGYATSGNHGGVNFDGFNVFPGIVNG